MDTKTEGRIIGILGLLLALIPLGWHKMPPIMSHICRILAGICFLLWLYFIIPKNYIIKCTYPVKKVNKMFLIAGMILGGIIFIYCAVAYFGDVSEKPKTEQATAEEIASEVLKKLPTKTTSQTGNLKHRAIALSDEIMEELYSNGWNPILLSDWKPRHPIHQKIMPNEWNDTKIWADRQSRNYKHKFYKPTIELINEFSQLHYSDRRLDEIISYRKLVEDLNKQLLATGKPQREIYFMPQEIEEIAFHLRFLANQIK